MRAREILATRLFKGRIDERITSTMDELKSNLKETLGEKQMRVSRPLTHWQVLEVLDDFFS